MDNEKGRNKTQRERKRSERLGRLIGIDFCACGGGHQLRCKTICRHIHTNVRTGKVECDECYQIDDSDTNDRGRRRPKRTWKFGNQKDGNENKQIKQNRKEKLERDNSQSCE